MTRTAIQLYSLRDLEEPIPSILDRIGETSFDGVEFAHRVGQTEPREIERALERTGLTPAAAHVGLEALEEDLSETVELYTQFGCDTFVVPYLDDDHFASPEAVESTATRLSEVAAALEGHGIDLHYHNHDHEFVACGDRTAMEALLERTDDAVGFEIDLGWANVGGVDPVSLLERYRDRISLVHLADAETSTGTPTELGEGDLDLEACLDAVERTNAEWGIYEHDRPTDPIRSLSDGAETLERLG
ncbi:sugar phosphate isomerase/epimerase family protein [Halostagnicola kamekurae]|uniref:Sugar phosphate isomerase/epimerase n=1 Tax=Halostagnicola kamekurae TaxID=619731 RepID=A0A1I6UFZ1_9EURY|nr:sugar phosphate isomerase/epimerase [Halostagnicola kamekurae]SFT00308.1 Sugar phosphate isomerase/epimerase [Halostagnicola kamekurae]